MNVIYPFRMIYLFLVMLLLSFGQGKLLAATPVEMTYESDSIDHVHVPSMDVKDMDMPMAPKISGPDAPPPAIDQTVGFFPDLSLQEDSVYPPLYLKKAFPADTLQQFLKLYGKDSLVRLLDHRISLVKGLLVNNISTLNDEHAITVLQLVSKQYKLGFDTLKFPLYKTDTYFLKLYGYTQGKVYDYLDTAKLKMLTPEQFHDFYVAAFSDNNISEKIALALAIVAPYVNVSGKTIEALIKHYSTLKFLEAPDYLYYALREYGNNEPVKKSFVQPYAQPLADSLYANNNFPKAMDKHLKKKLSSGYLQDFLKPMRFMAYGLYFSDITPDKNGQDLMYLLASQRTDGGWYSTIGTEPREYSTSIYGLWALCEFRAKASAMK